MQDFWNERYSTDYFAYGEKPNRFVKEQLQLLRPGTGLFPAEGEGRNAVYAATRGWKVTAFDPSSEGRKKALQLAKKYNTSIDYRLMAYHEIDFLPESFDSLVLVFAHMPGSMRRPIHQKLAGLVKPGGRIILEGFSKAQIERNSGGPRNTDMLFSKEELIGDFKHLRSLEIEETDTLLDEGPFHQGTASVVRLVGIK